MCVASNRKRTRENESTVYTSIYKEENKGLCESSSGLQSLCFPGTSRSRDAPCKHLRSVPELAHRDPSTAVADHPQRAPKCEENEAKQRRDRQQKKRTRWWTTTLYHYIMNKNIGLENMEIKASEKGVLFGFTQKQLNFTPPVALYAN